MTRTVLSLVLILLLCLSFAGCNKDEGDNDPGPTGGYLNTPLTVTSTSPADNAINVRNDIAIRVTYSADVDPSRLSSIRFTSVPEIAGTLRVSNGDVLFDPSSLLTFGMTYSVTISGAIGVDQSIQTQAHTWQFTVIPRLTR